MNKIVVFVVLCFYFLSCHRMPQQAQTYRVEAKWEEGESFRYKFVKTKHEVKFGLDFPEIKTEQVAIFEVKKKDEFGYELEWSVDEILIPEGQEMDLSSLTQYKSMVDSFPIKYRTNIYGQFSELINWEEVLEFNMRLMDEVAKLEGRYGTEKYKEERQGILTMFGTKELVSTLFMRDIKMLHSLYGITLNTNETTTEIKQIPYIFGSNALPVTMNYRIKSINKKDNMIDGVEYLEFDDELKKKMLIEFLQGMKPGYASSVDIAEEMSSTEMTYSDNKEFSVNYLDGIVHKLYFERNAVLKTEGMDLERLETTLFEKI